LRKKKPKKILQNNEKKNYSKNGKKKKSKNFFELQRFSKLFLDEKLENWARKNI